MLQAILDCTYESFSRYDENRDMWTTIRCHCKGLLGTEDYCRSYELSERDVFNYNVEDNRLTEWKIFLDKCDPDGEDVGSNDYEGQACLRDDIENEAKVMCKRVIAYHQLEAYSLYLKDKPAELAAYREFLVSVVSTVLACIIIAMIIISHHHSVGALQSRGYCQQGAWAASDFHSTGEIRVGSSGGKCGS